MALTPLEVDDLHEQIKKLLELWMRTKLVFLKAFGDEPITREQEAAYLQLKSEVARINRAISAKLPSGLLFEGEKMNETLKNAMTMEHLHNQPPAERQLYYATWHRVFIRLTRTLGALDLMKAGYYPHLHRELMKPPEKSKRVMPSAK
jgi:hypothetical protein